MRIQKLHWWLRKKDVHMARYIYVSKCVQWKIGSSKSWRGEMADYIQPSDLEAKTAGELFYHTGADGMHSDESSSQDGIITNLN